jgi:hypothetical protein
MLQCNVNCLLKVIFVYFFVKSLWGKFFKKINGKQKKHFFLKKKKRIAAVPTVAKNSKKFATQ